MFFAHLVYLFNRAEVVELNDQKLGMNRQSDSLCYSYSKLYFLNHDKFYGIKITLEMNQISIFYLESNRAIWAVFSIVARYDSILTIV